MLTFKYLCYCGLVLSSLFCYVSSECEIDPFSSNAPLIIQKGTTKIIYPRYGERTIKFNTEEEVEFTCPQQQVVVDGVRTQAVVQAACISNARFRVNGERYLWTQLSCSNNPVATGRFLNSNCGTNARLAEIGFNLGSNRFIRTMTICFDTQTQSALYSYFDLTASIGTRDTTTPRPQFQQDNGFYNIGTTTVNALYVRTRHRRTINGLVGLAATSTKYVDNGQVFFLSRGHLTARADFIYGALQNATYKYINAAPQWQGFNGGNWNLAETNTRDYAHTRNVSLEVWSGTYGTATLPHETTGQDIPLNLYVNGNTRAIPVPAIFWRIVFNPVNRRGIVLIGLNNPFETDVAKYIICPDVSNQVNWLTWNAANLRLGYSYACTIPNFRKVVTYAPNLSVSGLLV